MSGEEFLSQYKLLELLEKRMNVYETQVNALHQEVARLRNVGSQNRDAITRLDTALLGNSSLGMDGLLVRLDEMEKHIVRGWWVFIIAVALTTIMNGINFYFIFYVMQRLP
jgi:hypothetical protein